MKDDGDGLLELGRRIIRKYLFGFNNKLRTVQRAVCITFKI